jgi:hypothetical protein
MFKFKTIATAALVATIVATGAIAATFTKYGDVEGWKVFVDTEKKSCLIEKIDDVGNVVQMGLTADRGVGYVGIFTLADTDIKKDDKQGVAIAIGDNLYIGQVTGMRGNITKGYSGGYVLSDDPQFVTDIAQQYEMVVFPEQEWAFVVDLTGTKKAIELARECNASL